MADIQSPNRMGSGARVVKNAVGSFLAGAGWAIVLGSFVVQAHWVSLAPQTPDVPHGFVYRQNEHGSFTYFTAYQNAAHILMLFGGVALAILAVSALPKRHIVLTTTFISWNMRFEPDDPEGVRYRFMAVGVLAGTAAACGIDPSGLEWCFEQLRNLLRL